MRTELGEETQLRRHRRQPAVDERPRVPPSGCLSAVCLAPLGSATAGNTPTLWPMMCTSKATASHPSPPPTLLKDGHIDTAIGLPANLLYSTGIPLCILVLKKCKKPDDVVFINAAEQLTPSPEPDQSGFAQRCALSVSLSPLAEFGS